MSRCEHALNAQQRTKTLVDGTASILDLGVDDSKLQIKLLPIIGVGRFFEQNIWRFLPFVCRPTYLKEKI